MKLCPVPRSHLDRIWNLVECFADDAAEYSRGTWTPDGFLKDAHESLTQLWAVADAYTIIAAGGTRIALRADGRKSLHVIWIGGVNMKAWAHLFDQVKAWARGQGCSLVEFEGRRGWQRARPECRPVAVIYEEPI